MNASMKEKNRIAHYDILRGVAISLMLMANSAAYVYSATPPLSLRVMGSFAAPCFMILAGMMLVLTKKPKPMRGLYIIAIGGLVDVIIWHIMPFVTYDVLYTIGVAIVITAYPARFFSLWVLWVLGILFILAGQGLQSAFGYHYEILEIALPPENPLPLSFTEIIFRIFHQLFVDGWFPLFPWLGFVLLGAALQRTIQECTEIKGVSPYSNRLIMLFSIFSLILSSAYWIQGFVSPEPRMGYTELFYPPDAGFCFTYASAFCVILFLFQAIVSYEPMRFILMPFKWMGQRSLLIYILHLAVIQYILSPYFKTPKLDKFLYIVLVLWVVLAIIARIPTNLAIRRHQSRS